MRSAFLCFHLPISSVLRGHARPAGEILLVLLVEEPLNCFDALLFAAVSSRSLMNAARAKRACSLYR